MFCDKVFPVYHCACGCDRWSGLSCVFVWRRQREGQWLRGSGNMARTEPSWRQLFRGIQKLFYPFTRLRRGVTIMFISWLYRGNYFIASTQFLEQPNFKLVIAEDFDWYLIYFRIFVGACQSMSMSCIFLKTHWLQLWPELRLVWQTHWSAAGTYLPFANRLLPLIDRARSFEANQITSKISDIHKTIATGETSQLITSRHFSSFLFTSNRIYVYSNFFGSYQLKGKYNSQ